MLIAVEVTLSFSSLFSFPSNHDDTKQGYVNGKKDTLQLSSKVFSISVDYRRARDLHSTASSLKSPSEKIPQDKGLKTTNLCL